MTRTHRALALCLALIAPVISAGIRPAPNYPVRPYNQPLAGRWDTLLPPIWEGWKKRFAQDGRVVDRYHGPSSQAQAHGMLLSVWFGDQAMFDSLWKATESNLWDNSRSLYRESSSESSQYPAEPNFELCGALLFASALVKADLWRDSSAESSRYLSRANTLFQSLIRNYPSQDPSPMVTHYGDPSYRKMSDQSAGWFRVFQEAAPLESLPSYDWPRLESGTMTLLQYQPNSPKGMIRNICSPSGGRAVDFAQGSTPNASDMGNDALRAVWHLATAIRWNPSIKPSLVTWARNVWKAGYVNPERPGMYRVDDVSLLGWDSDTYQHFMTRALWGSLAAAAQDSADTSEASHNAFHTILDSLEKSMVPGVDFLVDGDTSQSAPAREDLEAQTLGLLGILSMTNNTPNVWADLHNTCCGPSSTIAPAQPIRGLQRVAGGYLVAMERDQALRCTRSKIIGIDGKTGSLASTAFSTTSGGVLLQVAPSATLRWIQLEDQTGKVQARASIPPSL